MKVVMLELEYMYGPSRTMEGSSSMVCLHICGFIGALMIKGRTYEEIIQDDNISSRMFLNDKFTIDIASEGRGIQT